MQRIHMTFFALAVGVTGAAAMGQTQPAVPVHIPLSGMDLMQPGPGIEASAIYDLLPKVRDLPAPSPSRGVPYDRDVLLAQPEAFAGDLLTTTARYMQTDQVRLRDAGTDEPALAWSTLAVDSKGRPIQVLSLGARPDFEPLATIRAVGYFYRIRQDKAADPGPDGKTGSVLVPMLVGWVLPTEALPAETPPGASRIGAPGIPTIVAGTVAAVVVVFFVVAAKSRRRVDWRQRAAQRRPRRDRDGSADEDQA